MTRVVAYVPDLLFGSQLQGAARAAGHEVALAGEPVALREAIVGASVLVVDLTAEPTERVELFEELSREGLLGDVRTLAFYSHVDADVRRRAQAAGFDLVVPRSRIAREGPALIAGLLDTQA
jgi:hypothetical protein